MTRSISPSVPPANSLRRAPQAGIRRECGQIMQQVRPTINQYANLRLRIATWLLLFHPRQGGIVLRHRQRDASNDWAIVYGTRQGIHGYTLDEVNRCVQKNVEYPAAVVAHDAVDDELLGRNLVVVGLPGDNTLIDRLIAKGAVQTVGTTAPETLCIEILANPFNAERQMVVLTGSDAAGVLYAVRDFEHFIIDPFTRTTQDGRIERLAFAQGQFEPVRIERSPAIRRRGFWTWGRSIYDYKQYIDHMSKWKLNTLTIWNDIAPVNAREIVDYARSRGVDIIWGYSWSWGWDDEIDPTNQSHLKEWCRRVVDTYERVYRDTGAKGVYSQLFTETRSTTIEGHSVASLAARWVNYISDALLAKYPDLEIQFGVHATSIQDHYPELAAVDPRVTIVWEDVFGFPYSYQPDEISQSERAIDYTRDIVRLREDNEQFGAVLKGMVSLNWEAFEYQTGPALMGMYDPRRIEELAQAKLPRWRFVERYYRENLDYVLRTLKVIAERNPGSVVQSLLEDGLWDHSMWLPGCLFAEALWDPTVPTHELIHKVSLTQDARSAL